MALSGSTDFSINARELIVKTLRKIEVLGVTQALDADEAEDCRLELNLMLKGWQKAGPHLWKKAETTVNLLAATTSYSLEFAGALRVLSVRYRNAAGVDLPMRLMTREFYFNLPQKASTGIPTQYYFDPQRGAATLYVWQALAAVTTETLQITHQKRIDDIDDLSNDIDIPQEHFDTLLYAFAERLLDDYGVEGEVAARIIGRSQGLIQQALDWEREDELVFEMGR